MIISYVQRVTHIINIIRNISDPKDGSGNSSNSSRVCTFVPIPPGAMVLHRMSWPDEQALFYEWEVQIGADNSLVFDNEAVFVIRPDELFGKIEHVDYFHGVVHGRVVGQMAVDDRDFHCRRGRRGSAASAKGSSSSSGGGGGCRILCCPH